ncbi:peptidase domain-containing ABC transporter [Accumulibacter sp.]|uniref:peptidase domain-containing ABC transporter n=1 Tax=Accumulibacter sp. TaxID=2053492 RepID=UPI00263A1384|nr:peptidase domain-containing ABC transporter [Accumulibacter sp.]
MHQPISLLEEIGCQEVLWLLGSLSALHRLPFDAALIAQEFPPPYTLATLHTAARALGFRTGDLALAGVDWQKLPLPAIAFLRRAPAAPQPANLAPPSLVPAPSTDESSSREAGCTPILVLRVDGERLLYCRPGEQTPDIVPLATAAEYLASRIIVVAREAAAAGEGEEIAGFPAENERFGFRWFIPELLKYKAIWRDVLTASLAIQLVGLATPLFTQVIIDKVIVHHSQSTLVVLGMALVMFMLFSAGMTWLRQYLVLHTGNRIDAVLGSQVFAHLLRLPLPYFEHRPTGTLVARLQGVETIREFVSGAAVSLILDLPFLLVFLVVMFAYSWQLSLIAVSLLGAIAGVSFLVAPLLRDKLNRQFLLGARNQAFLTEYIAGMATVKALQMEPDIDRKYGDYLAQVLAAGFATKQVGNTYHVVANGLEQVMTLAILITGALLVMQNDGSATEPRTGFTVGMLVAFQMFAGRMSQPLLRIVGLWQEFQQASIAVKRLGDILDMPLEPHTLTPNNEKAGQGRLTIVDLAFRYSDHHPWLYQQLTFAFQPGRLTVVTGPSGCGKSTLAKLMLGFYQPVAGHIALDGKDIRYLAANELRATFGVVPQETVLFAGTLYDNLVMAHPHASFEDVIAACKAAEIHEVIEKLPKAYQTEIGERGSGLSGGQRQRIAIARALLKRPRILIFDEAVSNLDQQTAEHLAKTINRLKGKATMILITHYIPRGLQVDEVFSLGSTPSRSPP